MLPKQVKVGKTTYRVVQTKQPKHIYGRIWYQLGTIEIAPREADKMRGTFWHEMVHAILKDMDDPRYDDEDYVTAIGTRLHKAIESARF
jgi:hypothetical protein